MFYKLPPDTHSSRRTSSFVYRKEVLSFFGRFMLRYVSIPQSYVVNTSLYTLLRQYITIVDSLNIIRFLSCQSKVEEQTMNEEQTKKRNIFLGLR